jgi:hypothetical protein
MAQEGEDLLWGKGFGRPVTKLGRKLGEKMKVIPKLVFSRVHPVVVKKRPASLRCSHRRPHFLNDSS